MFGHLKTYLYSLYSKLRRMLLVKADIGLCLRDSVLLQVDDSFEIVSNSRISDEVRVHELRKSIKRGRALLRLLKSSFEENTFYNLDESFAKSGRCLTEHREATVNLQTFINLSSASEGTLPESLRVLILEALSKRINNLYNISRRHYSAQIQACLLHLKMVKEKLECSSLLPINNKLGIDLINKSYQKSAKLYSDAHYTLNTEIIHKWRRYTKILLYQLKLSPLRLDVSFVNMISMLENLTDTFGDEHDTAVMEGYIMSHLDLAHEDKQKIHLMVTSESARLQNQAFLLGRALFSETALKSQHFVKDLSWES
jgi:CHAD domain-containing protein